MDELRLLQTDAALKLAAEAAFQYVPVSLYRPRDSQEAAQIQTTLDQSLAGLTSKNGKAGLAVLVFMPEAETPEPNTPGPRLSLLLTLRVYENVLINEGASGTQITAEQCALNILASLHHWTRGHQTLVSDRKAIKSVDDKSGRNVYDVTLRQDAAPPRLTKVTAPVITEDEINITITCATAGAAIYYTQDGTSPAPGNTGATLYSAPFEPVSQALIRAAAFFDGYGGSAISERQL